jgi:predicted amidohydrolase YtcJ
MRVKLLALVCLTLAAAACERQPEVEPATLVLRGGKIVTVDDARPEAQAMAVRGDRIVALGSDEEIAPYVGPATEVIELEGRMAMPGFIEGHGHFTGLGQSMMNLDLMDATSWDQIVQMVGEAAKAAKPGDWITGRGWHQEKWGTVPEPNVEGFPIHTALSAASPDNPVLLTHASGHASYVNAKAMELVGYHGADAQPGWRGHPEGRGGPPHGRPHRNGLGPGVTRARRLACPEVG